MTSRNIQKELARKLVWAVNSTLATPEHAKKRVRAWGWRLAGKMLDAKQPSSLTNASSSRYPGMAGGGAAAALNGPSASPLVSGGRDAVPSTPSRQPGAPLRGETRPSCRWFHPETSRCGRSGCWWSGPGCFRGESVGGGWLRGFWRWVTDPTQTAQTRIDRRRYADDVDDRLSSLKKGCGELHTAAYKALTEMAPWQPLPSTTSQSGTVAPYVDSWPSHATGGAE